MDAVTDKKRDQLLGPPEKEAIAPEHRAWMNDEIRKTLAKIEAGEMELHDLDEVMREFGFDAR